MARATVKVTGTCKAGHTTTREGEHDAYGRALLTWRGECPIEGCTSKLIARRVRTTSTKPQETPSKIIEPPEPPAARRAVRKVTAYRDAPPTKRTEPKRDSEPAGVQATAPVPAVAQPEPAEPKPEPGEPKRARPRRRLSFSGPDTRDHDGWTIPNIY